MNHHAQHASPRRTHRAPARLLGLAAVAGLGLAAAPAAHAAVASKAVASKSVAKNAAPKVAQKNAGRKAAVKTAAKTATPHPTGAPKPAAAPAPDSGSQLGGLPLYPLVGTPLDLLSNNLRVPVGGMDVSTFPVTAPLRDGLPLREVPIVGPMVP